MNLYQCKKLTLRVFFVSCMVRSCCFFLSPSILAVLTSFFGAVLTGFFGAPVGLRLMLALKSRTVTELQAASASCCYPNSCCCKTPMRYSTGPRTQPTHGESGLLRTRDLSSFLSPFA